MIKIEVGKRYKFRVSRERWPTITYVENYQGYIITIEDEYGDKLSYLMGHCIITTKVLQIYKFHNGNYRIRVSKDSIKQLK